MIYLVFEHYYNGRPYEDAVSIDELKQAFDTLEKCEAYIRLARKAVKKNARKRNQKIRVTSDQYGVHCTISKNDWYDEYLDWTVKEMTVR